MTKAQTMTYGLNKQTVLPDPASVHADTFTDAAVSRNGSDDDFGPYPSLTMGLVQHGACKIRKLTGEPVYFEARESRPYPAMSRAEWCGRKGGLSWLVVFSWIDKPTKAWYSCQDPR